MKKDIIERCRNIRINIIRMIHEAGSGHLGGSLSAVELMSILYFKHLVHNPGDPWWEDRDRVIFSKGHASALLYSILAEAGYFPVEELMTFRKLDSLLQGHPVRNGLPGVEISTGSLGQGLSVGVGMALGLKLSRKNSRVYILLGDGECNCGQVWEAAMSASHYKLDNLCGILDYNGLQIDGTNKEVMNLEPLIKKWTSFGWKVFVVDGHNCEDIAYIYSLANKVRGRPSLVLGRTTKGKGVSFMEDQVKWHGKSLSDELFKKALVELGHESRS